MTESTNTTQNKSKETAPKKKASRIPKPLKIIAIILVVLIALVFIALAIAPKFAKGFIVDHAEEFIGRKASIEDISLNPLSFTLSIKGLTVFEKDGTTPFVSFDKFRVNVDPLRMMDGTAAVSEIFLSGLYAHVEQNGDQFNFSDILEFLAKGNETAVDSVAADSAAVADSTVAAADSNASAGPDTLNILAMLDAVPVKVDVRNILMEKTHLVYEDQMKGSKVEIQDLFVNIPKVNLCDKNTDVNVSMKFASGGDLKVNVEANLATNNFNVNVGLDQFALAVGKPYMNDFINYQDFSGSVTTHISVSGNLNDVLSSDVKGSVALDEIVLTETSGKTIGVNKVEVGIGRANLNENNFQVDSMVVDGAYAHLDMYKGGKTNIDVLLNVKGAAANDSTAENADSLTVKPVEEAVPVVVAEKETPAQTEEVSTETKEEAAKPMKVKITKFAVKNTKVSASDQTITKPFNYTVSAITVNGSNISLDEPFNVNVSAAFPEGGTFNLKFAGSLSDMGTMDAYISIKNLALKSFSNYSHHYTGYPISAGTMAFASDNKIKNFNLDSKNTIDIYNIDVADKDPNSNPEFTVPMKVGLYILKDKDDKIQFDIPVNGNLKDPQFSIGKIIWQTVSNLLVKVALSPLKIVGNLASAGAGAIGIDMGKNDELPVDPFSKTFTSEQYAKATKMAEALKKDPKLSLTFTQYYNPSKTAKAFKQHKLKTEYYKQKENKQTLNELDEKAILEISDKDEGFVAFTQGKEDLVSNSTLKKDLDELAAKRNQDLLNTLKKQSGINAKNLKVITAPKAELNSYRGKPLYKVTVDVQ